MDMSFTPEELAILDRALDRIGWDEIHAYHAELRKGQDIYEDGGGFFLRAIKALFGVRKADPVTTYQTAAREMITLARKEATNDAH
jgi:hypothetical protein